MFTRIIFCLCLLSGFTTSYAQRDYEEVMVDSRSLSADQINAVDAETSGGNILVEGVSNADARVEVYARSNKSGEVKQLYAEYYQVEINSQNGKLTLRAKRKKNLQRDPELSVSFRIYVPVAVSTQLNTSGGNIHCRHLTGTRQEIKTSGGNIALDDVKGKVSAKTSGGNIAVTGCSDALDLYTSGGNIHAKNSNGSLTMNTSGGNITLGELEGNIEAETSGGNVSAEFINGKLTTSSSGGNLHLRELSCSLDASTSGGNMDVAIKKAGEYVKLRNSGSGHTQLQLPEGISMNIRANGESVKLDLSKGFKGDYSERSINGTVNGGGIPVTIDGGDTRVVVTFRK